MAMDERCLRSEFTFQLRDALLAGESINLISPHGQGRRRTLQDLHVIFPKSWRILQVDMKAVEKSESTFLDELLKQGKVENISNIHDFMLKLNNTSIYHLIIIHNFHLFTDLNVISCLNEIEDYPYLSLLCVSEKQPQHASLLAGAYMLPRVTSAQLLVEIKRRDFCLNQEDVLLLAAFLLQQTSPYSLLDAKPKLWFEQSLWKSAGLVCE
jgi:hypothetical protein